MGECGKNGGKKCGRKLGGVKWNIEGSVVGGIVGECLGGEYGRALERSGQERKKVKSSGGCLLIFRIAYLGISDTWTSYLGLST